MDFDCEAYKGRSLAEQSFNIFKRWRSIATRYDELAITYRSGVALYLVLVWVRHKETRGESWEWLVRDWLGGLMLAAQPWS